MEQKSPCGLHSPRRLNCSVQYLELECAREIAHTLLPVSMDKCEDNEDEDNDNNDEDGSQETETSTSDDEDDE